MTKKMSSLDRIKDSLIFKGEILDIYLPKSNFDKNLSTYNGEYINTMGIFSFIEKKAGPEDKTTKGTLRKLELPNMIDFQYDSSYSFKGKLSDELPSDTYEVFRLTTGNQFIANVFTEQNASNVKKFISALHGGNIPSSVSYDNIIKLYLDTLSINKVSLRSPSVIYELIISELCRYSKDINEPFRKIIASKNNISPYMYTNINLKKLPSINSTFAALSFENPNQAIIDSINKNINGEKENESPIERTIKY
ncbi:hypothetical protein FPHOBKDP_00146 [Listeria phage LPJP1]|nr:hypothetical protein FPHOBKDP_00146 [Listeria phage LPJP1]